MLLELVQIKVKEIPPADPGIGPAIIINDARSSNITPYLIGSKIKESLSYLNPLSWIPTASEYKAQYDAFTIQQESLNYNNQLYPFTSNNPFDSWIKKLRIGYFGESTLEFESRTRIKNEIVNILTDVGNYYSSPVCINAKLTINRKYWVRIEKRKWINLYGTNRSFYFLCNFI